MNLPTNQTVLRTLLIEDSESDALLIVRHLTRAGFKVEPRRVDSAQDLEAALKTQWDLVICDYNLPRFNAHAAIAIVNGSGIDVPVIVISGSIGEEIAVDMMHEGAHDYLLKNNLTRLAPAVERELREAALRSDRRRAADSLRRSEEKLRSTISSLDDLIFVFDQTRKCTSFYQPGKSADLFLRPEEFIDRNIQDIGLPSDVIALFQEALNDLDLHDVVHTFDFPLTLPGGVRWFSTRASRRMDGGEKFAGAVVVARDISDRKRDESALRLWAQVFEDSRDGIVIADLDATILSVNRAFTEITGYVPSEVVGRNPRILSSGKHDPNFFRDMWTTLLETGRWHGEIWNRRKNGEVYPEWLALSTVRNKDGKITNYLGIFADITESKLAQEKIDYLAHYDPLTGLPNRILFRDRFEQALAKAARENTKLALLYLDIDRLRVINASLGYPAGDKLVKSVSERLKSSIADTAAICRQGGDEFLILEPSMTDVTAAAGTASKILRLLSAPMKVALNTVTATASIGIAVYPDDGADLETLFGKADSALTHAKESGRNTYRFFTEALNRDLALRLDLEQRLRNAIEQGGLSVAFQPQIDLKTGALIGAEALARWRDPVKGDITPDVFIPIAESSGLIVPLGEWVLREACRGAAEWHSLGVPIIVGVNLSALQFSAGDIVTTVQEVLKSAGLPASQLELELTESMLVQNVEETLGKVIQLRCLGVRFSIDDFGTGYSSLTYLRRFPFDRLKLDRSFTLDIKTDADAAAIARAIIQMGKSMRLRVIAEGVEDADQQAFLEKEGCEEAQGYLFGRPVSPDEFLREHVMPRRPNS